MIRLREIDRLLILSTLFLVAIGVVMVYSTSSIVAIKKYGDQYFFVKKHLTFAFAGLLLLIAAAKIPYGIYRKMAYPVMILAAIFLVCIYIPGLGFSAGGARRWVRLGPLAFQPSEPAKLSVIFFLAYSLSSKAERIKNFSTGLLPNIVFPGIIIGLIVLEPDLGTSFTIALLVFIMSFVAGARLTHLLALGLSAVPFIYYIVHNFRYMMDRIFIYLDPWKDPEGKGFQMVQSFLAFGSGGIDGVGLGQSRQKLFFLPEAHTDFILSVIGEELGLFGVMLVVAFYAAFLYCGTKIALKSFKANNLYGGYLALGLTFMVVLQAVINMGVVMGLLPTKGLPLPFISYGGTSLVVNMVAVGILLNIYIKENEA
ncbi:MAG: putative lipid II flippase FtsW [Deltaproteobacteria bacterium]|nr:putative lipid II flippase FtsW [Deltaproteobacteria bacterium]